MTVFSCRRLLVLALALVSVASAGSPTHTISDNKARGVAAGKPVRSFVMPSGEIILKSIFLGF